MKQISARWYEWSRYAPARRLDEHGHFLAGADGQPGVVIDPVPFNEGDREQIAELGGAAAVVLTSAARAEEGRRCAEALGCELITATGAAGETLPGGLLAMPFAPPGSTPEVALYHEDTSTALTGASVVGYPAGALSLTGVPGVTDEPKVGVDGPPHSAAALGAGREESPAAQTAHALRHLLSYGIRFLFVAAGTSILREPARALQDLVYRHDPAAMILLPDELRWDPPEGMWSLGTRFAVRFAECASPLGLKVLDFDLADVPPGRQSGQLHRHDGFEEAFVVLAGRGELITEHGAFPIRAGDVIGFPPRYQVSHAFRNTGDEPLRYLAFGASAETLDMVDYPETNVRAEFTPYGKRHRFLLPEQRGIPYWEGVRTD